MEKGPERKGGCGRSRTLWIRIVSTSSIQVDGDSSRLLLGMHTGLLSTGTIPVTEAPKARLGEVPPGSSPIFICTLNPLGVGSCFGDFQPSGPLTSFLEWTGVSPRLQGASLCPPEAVRQPLCNTQFFQGFPCGWHDRRGKGLASGDRLSVSVHPRRGSILQAQWDD